MNSHEVRGQQTRNNTNITQVPRNKAWRVNTRPGRAFESSPTVSFLPRPPQTDADEGISGCFGAVLVRYLQVFGCAQSESGRHFCPSLRKALQGCLVSLVNFFLVFKRCWSLCVMWQLTHSRIQRHQMKRKYRFSLSSGIFALSELSFEFCDTPAVVSSESSCPTRSHTLNYYRNEKQNQNRSNKDNEISPKPREIVPLGKRTVALLPDKHVQCSACRYSIVVSSLCSWSSSLLFSSKVYRRNCMTKVNNTVCSIFIRRCGLIFNFSFLFLACC